MHGCANHFVVMSWPSPLSQRVRKCDPALEEPTDMPVPASTMNPAVRLVQGPGKVLHEENSRTALTMTTSTKQARKERQFLAAFSATLGALCAGTFFAWSTAVPGERIGFKDPQDPVLSWIASSLPLGAFFGCMVAGMAANRLGRQRTLLLMSVPLLAAWGFMLASDSVACLLVGRLLAGLAVGVVSVSAGMYVSEVAEASVRGTLGSFFQLQIVVGILFGYVTGLLDDPAHQVYVCMVLPVVFAALFWRMPESPVFLVSRGRSQAARDALQWLRGDDYDISDEISTIRHSIMVGTLAHYTCGSNVSYENVSESPDRPLRYCARQTSEQSKASFTDLFTTRAASRGMIVALGLMGAQQLSGINAVIFYAGDIFQKSGSTMSGLMCAIVVGVVQVAATFVSMVLADAAGRRVLLLLSSGVMTVCLSTLGVYYHLSEAGHTMDGITWLPLVTVAVYIVMFSLGLGPLPWCVVSEIFSPSTKGAASSVACGANWFMAFLVTRVFKSMISALEQSGAFFVFAAIAALGTLFIALLVPETKGKSLEEILDELAGIKSFPVAVEATPEAIEEEEGDEANNRRPFPL
ncbi:Facilitated trehalose transporter Tret1 [Frankliniella fusca]|uniref:Facilitated trehalose transporter Tret1 n=1 Tax=Frankliniella fusca TaxID=407009 RepID=A0AAE1LDS2_9NEOP|nr:Facilitated trehalose transporter Tret1 [Frankliniella fusca]